MKSLSGQIGRKRTVFWILQYLRFGPVPPQHQYQPTPNSWLWISDLNDLNLKKLFYMKPLNSELGYFGRQLGNFRHQWNHPPSSLGVCTDFGHGQSKIKQSLHWFYGISVFYCNQLLFHCHNWFRWSFVCSSWLCIKVFWYSHFWIKFSTNLNYLMRLKTDFSVKMVVF